MSRDTKHLIERFEAARAAYRQGFQQWSAVGAPFPDTAFEEFERARSELVEALRQSGPVTVDQWHYEAVLWGESYGLRASSPPPDDSTSGERIR
jgi:hypothetical protein